jgi:hypothetical protein
VRQTELTRQIADTEERRIIHRGLGEVAAHIYTEVMIPIVRQYPDLDPIRDKSGPGFGKI